MQVCCCVLHTYLPTAYLTTTRRTSHRMRDNPSGDSGCARACGTCGNRLRCRPLYVLYCTSPTSAHVLVRHSLPPPPQVRSCADLYGLLDEHRVGDRIKLDVVRDAKAISLSVTLGERVLGSAED